MRSLIHPLVLTIAAVLLALPASAANPPPAVIVGDVRVQLLSDSLVRLEAKGAQGFEDRVSFHILGRDWPGATFATKTNATDIEISTASYIVHIPVNATSLENVRVDSASGQSLYQFDGKLENSKWLPAPADNPQAWWFADTPRLIPAAQGLTPSPTGATNAGWDLGNDAADVFVFVPRGDYRQLRRDFLKLTGPSDLPPLYALGAFDSRWFDYSEATALQQIEDYRARKIPLDVLVVDTGWRRNASTGYNENTNLFPDMKRFFAAAHAKNVRILFNDHPEPLNTNWPALDARELQFRFDGLAGWLEQGLDVWWYDRNWWVALVAPAPNLVKEVWGMRMYHDITERVRPQARPLIMANVDGIDNGIRKRPPNIAAHRFTFQWTGDTFPGFDYLRRGVENCVHAGVAAAYPYMSEDLGGHSMDPTPEAFIRWIEFGALSPIYRPHCTHDLKRMPWAFGPQAEEIARDYLNMRYRLLPVLYAACRENYETGEPLLRRLDLDYPQFAEARRDDQYLLGQSILVAPVLQGSQQAVPAGWFTTADGKPGLQAEYFTGEQPAGAAALRRVDASVDFDWGNGSPDAKIPSDHFSARWTGKLKVPAAGGDATLAVTSDDGVRVWLDDQLVVDNWKASDSATKQSNNLLKAGKTYRLRVEYMEIFGGALIQLRYQPKTANVVLRETWIPPGVWIDVWSGKQITGPTTVTNRCPLDQIPLFIKSGAVLALAPEMQFTSQQPWSPVTLDIYPRPGETNRTSLYEDDTLTTGYRQGEFRKTAIACSTSKDRKKINVTIAAATDDFPGALKERAWVVRLHRPADWPGKFAPTHLTANGQTIAKPFRIARNPAAMPFGDKAGAPDADVLEITLPAGPVTTNTQVQIEF